MSLDALLHRVQALECALTAQDEPQVLIMPGWSGGGIPDPEADYDGVADVVAISPTHFVRFIGGAPGRRKMIVHRLRLDPQYQHEQPAPPVPWVEQPPVDQPERSGPTGMSPPPTPPPPRPPDTACLHSPCRKECLSYGETQL